jgi:2-oxoglutarate ferredoxin oxidoreductase subunit beta
VTFHNREGTLHSYTGGKETESPLHEISFVPRREEIVLENFSEGQIREVRLHDGSVIVLKKLSRDYDPTNRSQALCMLADEFNSGRLVTGLIYIDPDRPSMFDAYNLPETPLNRLSEDRLRPPRQSIEKVNALMF